MKKQPEVLFADYGDHESFGPLLDACDSTNPHPFDLQFYTPRRKMWTELLTNHFKESFQDRKIPHSPDVINQGTGKQIKVKNAENDEEKFLITIFLYDNGFVMIQGKDFLEWSRLNFELIKAKLPAEDGKNVKKQVPSSPKQQLEVLAKSLETIAEDDMIQELINDDQRPTEGEEKKEEEIKLSPPTNSPIKNDLLKNLNVLIPTSLAQPLVPAETIIESDSSVFGEKENAIGEDEREKVDDPKGYTEEKNEDDDSMNNDELKDKVINSLQNEVERLKTDKYELFDKLASITWELQNAKKCSDAKDYELTGIRQNVNQNKLNAKLHQEELQAYKNANDLLVGEIELKDDEIRKQKSIISQQKKEVKALLIRNEDLIKTRIGLEKSLTNVKEINDDELPESLSVPKPRGKGKKKREKKKADKKKSVRFLVVDSDEEPIQEEPQNIPVIITRRDTSLEDRSPSSHTQNPKNSQNSKKGVYVIGDSFVRGLGPLIQDGECDGQVAVRGGFTIADASSQIGLDIDQVNQGTTIVMGYGLNDLQLNQEEVSKAAKDLIETAAWNNFTERVNIGILEVPPQRDFRRNQCANAMNSALHNECTGTNIRVISCNLKTDDIGKDGEQLNAKGRSKVAEKIRMFVKDQLEV